MPTPSTPWSRPNGTSASTMGLDEQGRGVWLLRGALPGLFGARPRFSAAEPASTDETVALHLPPRAQLLQPSGSSQLVYLAQDRLQFLFVA